MTGVGAGQGLEALWRASGRPRERELGRRSPGRETRPTGRPTVPPRPTPPRPRMPDHAHTFGVPPPPRRGTSGGGQPAPPPPHPTLVASPPALAAPGAGPGTPDQATLGTADVPSASVGTPAPEGRGMPGGKDTATGPRGTDRGPDPRSGERGRGGRHGRSPPSSTRGRRRLTAGGEMGEGPGRGGPGSETHRGAARGAPRAAERSPPHTAAPRPSRAQGSPPAPCSGLPGHCSARQPPADGGRGTTPACREAGSVPGRGREGGRWQARDEERPAAAGRGRQARTAGARGPENTGTRPGKPARDPTATHTRGRSRDAWDVGRSRHPGSGPCCQGWRAVHPRQIHLPSSLTRGSTSWGQHSRRRRPRP